MRSAADGAPSFVHVPGLAQAGGEIAIEGEEAHYLRRVVRIRPGEVVTASDGRGALAELRVLEPLAASDVVRAEVLARRRVERGPGLDLWCGAPQGDRADWLVEKLAELGVASFQPLDCERGGWERAERRAERWRRLAVAAMRQSRSAFVLSIAAPVGLDQALAARQPTGRAYLADPEGEALRAAAPAGLEPVTAAVGPSSGFSAAEINRLRDKGFAPIRLTANRLRTETAALAMAALLLAAARHPEGA
jgi:16S rRNA (uracil1498-N3)-methyltransferase